MSLKCYFQYDGGRFCKNWAMQGSRFCQNHQPPEIPASAPLSIHPGVRLSSPKDVLHLLSEALNGAHLGSMTPGKAYTIGYLACAWLKTYAMLGVTAREQVLRHQMLASMVDRESAALDEPPESPDPEPPAAAAGAPPAPSESLDPADPWAAGRMAGPVPSRDAGPVPPGPVPPGEPINLQEAQARLAELLGFQPDDEDQPLVPATPDPSRPRPSTVAAPPDASGRSSKPNGSPASRPSTKARDPAA